jgi:hypothetical protein
MCASGIRVRRGASCVHFRTCHRVSSLSSAYVRHRAWYSHSPQCRFSTRSTGDAAAAILWICFLASIISGRSSTLSTALVSPYDLAGIDITPKRLGQHERIEGEQQFIVFCKFIGDGETDWNEVSVFAANLGGDAFYDRFGWTDRAAASPAGTPSGRTGKLVPKFGVDGWVDLTQGLRRPVNRIDYTSLTHGPSILPASIVSRSAICPHRPPGTRDQPKARHAAKFPQLPALPHAHDLPVFLVKDARDRVIE